MAIKFNVIQRGQPGVSGGGTKKNTMLRQK